MRLTYEFSDPAIFRATINAIRDFSEEIKGQREETHKSPGIWNGELRAFITQRRSSLRHLQNDDNFVTGEPRGDFVLFVLYSTRARICRPQ